MTPSGTSLARRALLVAGALLALALLALCWRVEESRAAREAGPRAAEPSAAPNVESDAALAPQPDDAHDGDEPARAAAALAPETAAVAPAATGAARKAAVAAPALRVLVLDAAGRARDDVEVALLRIEDGRERVLERARGALASHASHTHELARVHESFAEPSRGSLAIGVLLPRTDAPRERVWPALLAAPSAAPLVLRLGAEASLRIDAREHSLAPALVHGTLVVRARGAERMAPLERGFDGPSLELGGLEPERELDVELRVGGRATVTRRVRAPRANERGELVLDLAPSGPVIALQVCASDGAPLRRQRVRLSLGAASAEPRAQLAGASTSATLRSDDDGRIEWALAPRAFAASLRLDVRADLAAGACRARCLLGAPSGEAHVELGALRLELEPLQAAGRVRSTSGAALARARVRMDVHGDDGARVGTLETRTRADGRFELRGELASGRVSLRASAAKHLTAQRDDLVPPCSELELALEPAGALEGRIDAPEGFPLEVLSVELSRAGEPTRTSSVAPNGHFAHDGLTPGRFQLCVRVGHEPPCARIADLDVRAGGTCADPRLASIDLRHELGWIDFELCDGDGVPLPLARLRVHDADVEAGGGTGTGAAIRETLARDGRVEWPTSRASLDVEIHASGYAARRERALHDGARVVLEPALRARIDLGAPLASAGAAKSVWAALVPVVPLEDELAQFSRVELERTCREARVRFGKSGKSAGVALPGAGRYEARVYVGAYRDEKRSRVVLRRAVSIAPRALTQTVALRVDAARVASWTASAAGDATLDARASNRR